MKLRMMHEAAKRTLIAVFASIATAMSANAASRYFPNEGGDIASPEEWGASGVPTSADAVSVN